MADNVIYMTLMCGKYDKALKIHYGNIIYLMHIDKLQNMSLLVVVAFQNVSYLHNFVSGLSHWSFVENTSVKQDLKPQLFKFSDVLFTLKSDAPLSRSI